MGAERNFMFGAAAFVASCATPLNSGFEFQPIDPHRLEQAETVFALPRNELVFARLRFINAFPGTDVAVIQTGGIVNQITASEISGMRSLVIRTCEADLGVIADEVSCTGQTGTSITDHGVDGIADEQTFHVANRDVIESRTISRIDREWNEGGVARNYHSVLDNLDMHARPRV